MSDFAAQLLAEEADLERKLIAVRQMKAAYGIATQSPNVTITPAGSELVKVMARRAVSDRMDKFGTYGQNIIDHALMLLPGEDAKPMPTRALVEMFETLSIEINGENKVNALSALLARSSKIKGYGRAGWTRRGPTAGELHPRIPGDDALKETEPTSENAVGSVAAGWGVPPPAPAPSNPNPGWSS